jgi:hypothetical protein
VSGAALESDELDAAVKSEMTTPGKLIQDAEIWKE